MSIKDVHTEKDMIEALNKEEIKRHTDLKDASKQNEDLPCGAIHEKTSTILQEKLEHKSDDAINKWMDPVWLLQCICQRHLMSASSLYQCS